MAEVDNSFARGIGGPHPKLLKIAQTFQIVEQHCRHNLMTVAVVRQETAEDTDDMSRRGWSLVLEHWKSIS